MQVIVRGITQKGKNRINEHGSVWTIVDDTRKDGQVLLESNNTKYLKWGYSPDFALVEETNDRS